MCPHALLSQAWSHITYYNLNQNSQAVIKECGSQKGQGEKRCEIQGGGQEIKWL